MISQAKRKHGELFSPAPRCGQTPDLRRGPLTTSSSKKTICAGIFIQRDCWMKAVLETGSPLAIFRHRQIDTESLLRPIFARHRPIYLDLRVKCCSGAWKTLTHVERKRAVFCVHLDGLAFADFAFENVDAEGVENFFLDRAPEGARAVNRVISFAREQFLG